MVYKQKRTRPINRAWKCMCVKIAFWKLWELCVKFAGRFAALWRARYLSALRLLLERVWTLIECVVFGTAARVLFFWADVTFNWACCVRVLDLFERMCFQIERRPPLIERAMFSLWTHLGLCELPYCFNFILCVCKFGAQQCNVYFYSGFSHRVLCAYDLFPFLYFFGFVGLFSSVFVCVIYALSCIYTHRIWFVSFLTIFFVCARYYFFFALLYTILSIGFMVLWPVCSN